MSGTRELVLYNRSRGAGVKIRREHDLFLLLFLLFFFLPKEKRRRIRRSDSGKQFMCSTGFDVESQQEQKLTRVSEIRGGCSTYIYPDGHVRVGILP